jgi:hypothetical protein
VFRFLEKNVSKDETDEEEEDGVDSESNDVS